MGRVLAGRSQLGSLLIAERVAFEHPLMRGLIWKMSEGFCMCLEGIWRVAMPWND